MTIINIFTLILIGSNFICTQARGSSFIYFNFTNSKNFNNTIFSHTNLSLINPHAFLPCLKETCDDTLGCFQPFLLGPRLYSLPPIAGCPEVNRKDTVRFVAISREEPHQFRNVESIRKHSKIFIYIHGLGAEYDESGNLLAPLAALDSFDYSILVDWSYLSFPYTIDHIIGAAPFLAQINTVLVGRITCKFIHWLWEKKSIDPLKIYVAGYSAGASVLSGIGEWCLQRYNILVGNFMALDLPAIPFRKSNYAVTNYTHAEVVNVIITTLAPPFPILEDLGALFTWRIGILEADGHCVFILNPDQINVDMNPCNGIHSCSHWFSVVAFSAALSERCVFRFSQCPFNLGTSSPLRGKTRFDCRDHPWIRRTCVATSPAPLTRC
ncbi:pancreatic lipase-related protein 3-like [Brevipalpus obovatus]|uniref:pancreatic lipase-related protein 3-like n=1 Tax=Brevipalpus obovatus TaxID=246614 RepID=UPI003D9F5B34